LVRCVPRVAEAQQVTEHVVKRRSETGVMPGQPLRRISRGLRIFALLIMIVASLLALTIAIEGFATGQAAVGVAGVSLLAGTATYAWIRYMRLRAGTDGLGRRRASPP
jgi:hypothetical protein